MTKKQSKRNQIPDEVADPEAYTNFIFDLLYEKNKKKFKNQLSVERVNTYALLQECCSYLEQPGYYDMMCIIIDFVKNNNIDYSETATDALINLVNNQEWWNYVTRNDKTLTWGTLVVSKLIDLGSSYEPIVSLQCPESFRAISLIATILNSGYKEKRICPKLDYPAKLLKNKNFIEKICKEVLCVSYNQGKNVYETFWKEIAIYKSLLNSQVKVGIFTVKIVDEVIIFLKRNYVLNYFIDISEYVEPYFDIWARSYYYQQLNLFRLHKQTKIINATPDIPQEFLEIIKTCLTSKFNSMKIYDHCSKVVSNYTKDKKKDFLAYTDLCKTIFNNDIVDYVILPYL
jgi:hypothetical protein